MASPATEGAAAAPHVLVFPFPGQGMVNCMLKLAELLAAAGINITFLNTDHNHSRFSSFSAAHARLTRLPGLRFLSIPDGLPDDCSRSVFTFFDLEQSLRTHAKAAFRDLLLSSRTHPEHPQGWPPVSCVIVDGLMPYAMDVAQEVGVPAIIFRTISACCFWAYLCVPKLIQDGEIPFPAGTSFRPC